jgi:RNA polymerase sigma factor (sigma-70 family)
MTKEVYGKAYECGFPRTIRFLISRGLGEDHARDIAQAAWMRGWERISQLRDEATVSTWVNTIALNLYRTSLRNNPALEPITEQGAVWPNFEAVDLRRLLKFCRPSERRLLEQQMQGLTAEEISRELGVSETAIRIRLLRARRSVRRALEKHASRPIIVVAADAPTADAA